MQQRGAARARERGHGERAPSSRRPATAAATAARATARASREALRETLEALSTCEVGLLERCDDTRTVVHAAFPWLREHFECAPARIERRGALRPHALDEGVVAEIRRQNALELEVYRVAGHLLDALVALARGASGEHAG